MNEFSDTEIWLAVALMFGAGYFLVSFLARLMKTEPPAPAGRMNSASSKLGYDPIALQEERCAQVLGVRPGASETEIEQAYQQLIAKYAPEKIADLGDEFRRLTKEKDGRDRRSICTPQTGAPRKVVLCRSKLNKAVPTVPAVSIVPIVFEQKRIGVNCWNVVASFSEDRVANLFSFAIGADARQMPNSPDGDRFRPAISSRARCIQPIEVCFSIEASTRGCQTEKICRPQPAGRKPHFVVIPRC